MGDEKDKIAARIRALLAKTIENGCTEDEAIAAAAKAAEMLAKYNLTVDEVELRASPFTHHTECHGDIVSTRLWKIASAVAYLTGARYWVSRPGYTPVEFNFFGFDHEVAVAKYLFQICTRAMRQQERRLQGETRLLTARHRVRKIETFLDGMADRLYERIKALKPAQPTGTGLIVVHDALIKSEMTKRKLNTEKGRAAASRDLEKGYKDGVTAGGRVPLNSAVSQDRPTAGYIA